MEKLIFSGFEIDTDILKKGAVNLTSKEPQCVSEDEKFPKSGTTTDILELCTLDECKFPKPQKS